AEDFRPAPLPGALPRLDRPGEDPGRPGPTDGGPHPVPAVRSCAVDRIAPGAAPGPPTGLELAQGRVRQAARHRGDVVGHLGRPRAGRRDPVWPADHAAAVAGRPLPAGRGHAYGWREDAALEVVGYGPSRRGRSTPDRPSRGPAVLAGPGRA